jgi:hypothetical protein
LPRHVQREFEDYLKCGRLEYGFLRVRCGACHAEKLVAFSCKRRGFFPSCGARRMAESAALSVDEVLPEVPMRQWPRYKLSKHATRVFAFATHGRHSLRDFEIHSSRMLIARLLTPESCARSSAIHNRRGID